MQLGFQFFLLFSTLLLQLGFQLFLPLFTLLQQLGFQFSSVHHPAVAAWLPVVSSALHPAVAAWLPVFFCSSSCFSSLASSFLLLFTMLQQLGFQLFLLLFTLLQQLGFQFSSALHPAVAAWLPVFFCSSPCCCSLPSSCFFCSSLCCCSLASSFLLLFTLLQQLGFQVFLLQLVQVIQLGQLIFCWNLKDICAYVINHCMLRMLCDTKLAEVGIRFQCPLLLRGIWLQPYPRKNRPTYFGHGSLMATALCLAECMSVAVSHAALLHISYYLVSRNWLSAADMLIANK